jgi:hypothetical protein
MSTNLKTKIEQKVKNPQIRELLLEIFDNAVGHDHDGLNSKAISESAGIPGTPVNAVAAVGTLTLSGVVIDGETVTIDGDVYEFLADAAQTKTSASNIAVDITSHCTAAQGTLTITDQVSADESFVIGSTTYTFKAVADEAGEIAIGVDEATTKLNIVAAINGTDLINSAHPDVSAADFVGDDCVITALVGGTAGDSIVFTEDITNGSVDGAGTLGTTQAGADCTAANADGALIGADEGTTYSLSQGTGTSVTVTAATKGTAGNSIAVSESMANGTFGSEITTLGDTVAGVDGTVGNKGDVKFDGSYMYLCTANNTVAGANWARAAITVGY